MQLKKQQEFQARLASMTCFKCGSKGHARSNCPMQTRDQRTTTLKDEKASVNLNPVDEISHSDHTEAQRACVDVDSETVLPENAETISDADITDDETSNSSKISDQGRDSMFACAMISSNDTGGGMIANTCDDAVVENTSKDDGTDSWNLEEVLSRAPWRVPLSSLGLSKFSQ
jgi:hypothetical protein